MAMANYSESELRDELKKADELNGLKDRRIARLEAETAATKAQLEVFLQAQRQRESNNTSGNSVALPPSTTGHSPSTAVELVPKSALDALGRRYAELESKLKDLEAEHGQCGLAIQGARAKAKDYKGKAKLWKQYINDWHKRHQSEVHMEQAHVSALSEQQQEQAELDHTPRASKQAPVANGSHGDYNATNNLETTTSDSSPITSRSSLARAEAPHSQSTVLRVTSSQTTADELNGNRTSPKLDSGSDSDPVFISARSLKRKAQPGAANEPPYRRIKQEASSPKSVLNLILDDDEDRLTAKESNGGGRAPIAMAKAASDLDTVGEAVITPHCSRQNTDWRERATSEAVTRAVPQLNRRLSSLSEGAVSHVMSISAALPIKSEPESDSGRAGEFNSVLTPSAHGLGDSQRLSEFRVLQPISANVPGQVSSRPENAAEATTSSSKRKSVLGRARLALVSEGGDESSQLASQNCPMQRSKDGDGVVTELLLNKPFPKKTPNPMRRPRNIPHVQKPVQAQLRTPVSAVGPSSPARKASSLTRPRGLEVSPPPVQPEDEPLRLRDVRTLKLNDFKVNPKYLGSEFAFADTLRGRDQRRALHSCTRPDCCGGALQKAVAMGGPTLSGKTDNQALEEYLGPQYTYMMSNYGAEKQKDIINQAHAHCFSRQHGKHRHAFERPQTPPGLWRTDFPTTQEIAEDRQRAVELEKQEVDDRYRDAMRGGGKWKFRDE